MLQGASWLERMVCNLGPLTQLYVESELCPEKLASVQKSLKGGSVGVDFLHDKCIDHAERKKALNSDFHFMTKLDF